MLKIRLKRTGRKKLPFYKVVLMENLSKRDGKAIAELGYYDPLKKVIQLDNKTNKQIYYMGLIDYIMNIKEINNIFMKDNLLIINEKVMED